MPNLRQCIQSPATVLAVTGEDARDYLQSQFSNDLRPTGPGECVYGLFLDRKGKPQADAFVLCRGDNDFLLASYHSDPATLQCKVEANLVADEVEIQDLSTRYRWITLWGDETALTPLLPPAGRFAMQSEALIFQGRRMRAPHVDALVPLDVNWPAIQPAPLMASVDDRLRERLASGLPAIPADIGPDDLPQEGGDLAEAAISYHKGCYLGQEVMARLHAMGRPQRALFRVRGDGSPPAGDALDLALQGKVAGSLRSRVSTGENTWEGLALLKTRLASVGARLDLVDNPACQVKVMEAITP